MAYNKFIRICDFEFQRMVKWVVLMEKMELSIYIYLKVAPQFSAKFRVYFKNRPNLTLKPTVAKPVGCVAGFQVVPP